MGTDTGKNTMRYSLFSLSGYVFGIEITYIKRIIAFPKVTKLPNVSAFVEGIYSLRGLMVTLIDLYRIMGLDKGPAGKAGRVILIEHRGEILSFPVDDVQDFIDTSLEKIQPITDQLQIPGKKLLSGLVRTAGGETVHLFDMDKLFRAGKSAISKSRIDL